MARSKFDTFTVFTQFPQEIRLMIWEHALPGPRVVNLRQKKLKQTLGEWETENARTWPPPKKEMLRRETGTATEDDHTDKNFIVDLRDSALWRGRQRNNVTRNLRAHVYDDLAYKEARLVGWVSDCPAPEILTVCREAFEVVSKFYRKVFASLGAHPTIWFCFEHDILYLRNGDFFVDDWNSGMLDMMPAIADSGFMILDTENLRQVKRVAISVPEDRDGEWEEMIADFSAAIGGLEKLYLVIKDYQGYWDARNPWAIMDQGWVGRKPLAIMEPIDFDATMAVYENDNPDSWKSLQSGVLLTPKLIQHRQVDVDVRKIQAMLEDDVEAGRQSWRIPNIEAKAVFTLELVEKLESVRRKYQKYLDDLGPSEWL